MAMKWTRSIDSAQRKIIITDPTLSHGPRMEQIEFHIQGITVTETGRSWNDNWSDMADRGVSEENEPPLTIWQRLLRKEARCGSALFSTPTDVQLTLWSKPRITIIFDLTREDEAFLFRECEIMLLSAGFHFHILGKTDHQSKVNPF